MGIRLLPDGQTKCVSDLLLQAYSRKALQLTLVILATFRHSWPNKVQAYLKDTASWVPNHHNKASTIIKGVILILLAEKLVFNL